MQGKELILKTFRLEKTDRVPWVPFVGCHGAKLVDATAEEYLKSADLIAKGAGKAIELYRPDGIPVMFDLQVEAETLGCQLNWSEDNPPAVVSHPLAEGVGLSEMKVPGPEEGRIPVVLSAARHLREKHPDIALYGLITGPYTLALHLMGTDIFMMMMENPDEVMKVMKFTREVGKAMAGYLIDAGCDVIAVVDPMTSQIDPDSFEMFVTPYVKDVFDFVRNKEALSSFFVCGHAQQNIEVMCKCGPDNISIDENIPLDFVRDVALKNGISFGGNMKLTVVLLMGTPEDSALNAVECLDLGGKEGFILAPGCDLPMDTPIENLQAVSALIGDPYQQEFVRTKERKAKDVDYLNLSDYVQSDRVKVAIITLDSESCAPCQYMVEAVRKVENEFGDLMEWKEFPIKKKEAVSFMMTLGVKNIPTICIDGQITFVSQIPPRSQLIAAIQKRIDAKKLNQRS